MRLVAFLVKHPFRFAGLLLALGLMVSSLRLAYMVPIYPDEVADRIVYSRWVTDGFTASITLPPCFSTQELRIPWSWVPTRFFNNALLAPVSRLDQLRLLGMTAFLLFGGLLLVRLRQMQTDFGWGLFLLVVAVLTSGLLPLLLSLFRAEAQILIHLVGLILLARAPLRLAIRLPLYLLVAAGFFSVHPKTILLFPLLLVLQAWFVGGRWRWWVFGGLTVATGFFAQESYFFYQVFYACPESVRVQQILGGHFVDPSLLLRDPVGFVGQIAQSLADLPRYFSHIALAEEAQNNWLPRLEGGGGWASSLQRAAFGVLFVAALLVPLWGLRQTAFKAQLTANPAILQVLALALGLVAFMVVNKTKNFYDSGFFFALLLLLLLEGLSLLALQRRKQLTHLLLFVFVPVAALSQFSNYRFLYLPLAQGQPTSGTAHYIMDFQRVEESITKTAALCGIGEPAKQAHLLLDDKTYLYYRQSKKPMLITYLSWGVSEEANAAEKALDILAHYSTPGIIAKCAAVENGILGGYRKEFTQGPGRFCCLGPAALERLYRQH